MKNRMHQMIIAAVAFCAVTALAAQSIEKKPFGEVDGKPVDLYTLTNTNGMTMTVSNYGAIITTLTAPDKNGTYGDVVLGYNDVQSYVKATPYFGAVVGRYGNRIAKGKFTLEGKEYTLATNNGPNSLHGGVKGFDKVIWNASEIKSAAGVGLALTYLSKDGEEGYPGNLTCKVTYLLSNKNELRVDYALTTDKTTVVNVTQHSYFNLAGDGMGDILNHELMLNADKFVPVDETLIPKGVLEPVKGTPMDFTTSTAIGARVNTATEQLKFGKGYDHCWVLNQVKPNTLTLAARVYEPTTGRVLEITTTEPGIQFYCGNFLDGTNIGKNGKPYNFRNGFALETQHYPDSPNQPTFPSTVIKPDKTYKSTTIFAFSARK